MKNMKNTITKGKKSEIFCRAKQFPGIATRKNPLRFGGAGSQKEEKEDLALLRA